jgi:hypothetical protein
MLLSVERDPPTWPVIQTGVMPDVIAFMTAPAAPMKVKFESAWVCTNIAAGSQETVQLVHMGVIPAIVHLYRSTEQTDVIEQAIWAIGNIAGENAHLRNLLLQTGVLRDLVADMHAYTETLQSNAIWTISNLCRHKPYPRWDAISCVVRPLAQLLFHTFETEDPSGVLPDILWTFSYLSDDPAPEINGQVQSLIDNGVVQALVKILATQITKFQEVMRNHRNVDVRMALKTMNFAWCQPCLRTIGNIVTGTDEHTQSVLDAGFLDLLKPFLSHHVSNIRKETLWTISNICAGNPSQIEFVLSREWLLQSVIDICMNDVVVARREAGWVLCNAANGSLNRQKTTLVDAGVLRALTSLLQLNDQETVLLMAMEGISSILEAHENSSHNPWADLFEDLHGLNFLEDIQGNTQLSEKCYHLAVKIVERFFEVDNSYNVDYDSAQKFLSETIQPTVDARSNQFTFGIASNNTSNNNNTNSNTNTNTNNSHNNPSSNNTNSRQSQNEMNGHNGGSGSGSGSGSGNVNVNGNHTNRFQF